LYTGQNRCGTIIIYLSCIACRGKIANRDLSPRTAAQRKSCFGPTFGADSAQFQTEGTYCAPRLGPARTTTEVATPGHARPAQRRPGLSVHLPPDRMPPNNTAIRVHHYRTRASPSLSACQCRHLVIIRVTVIAGPQSQACQWRIPMIMATFPAAATDGPGPVTPESSLRLGRRGLGCRSGRRLAAGVASPAGTQAQSCRRAPGDRDSETVGGTRL
jgi:hypothetical protein